MIKIIFNDKEKKALAFDKDNLIGCCDFIEKENVWNIVHTEVDKNYQGQGIACLLYTSSSIREVR